MSPHAIASFGDHSIHSANVLQKFGLTENGFLPSSPPLEQLPDPYYAPWEALIQHLPYLLQERALREDVDHLAVLSVDRLKLEAEWRRAYVILTFLTHAYIWGDDEASEILPPQISVPLLRVSSHLEVPPIATYAATNLWNFTCDGLFSDLDRLQALHTITGSSSESWFFMVSVAMESQGGRIIPRMLRALEAVKTRDYAVITSSLLHLTSGIRQVGVILERMHERCDPDIFYHEIRPYLAGSKNMAAAGLPRGVFYDEGHGRGRWMQLRGGSNGQSSLIQFYDILLGVDHTSNGSGALEGKTDTKTGQVRGEPEASFHEEVRSYMPGPHRRFLEHAARMGSIRNLALLPALTPEQVELRRAFQAATQALAEFRNKHLGIVARYIVLPSKRGHSGGRRRNLASASSMSQSCERMNRRGSVELTGTGGTALLPFLKQSRDDTLHAGKLSLARCE